MEHGHLSEKMKKTRSMEFEEPTSEEGRSPQLRIVRPSGKRMLSNLDFGNLSALFGKPKESTPKEANFDLNKLVRSSSSRTSRSSLNTTTSPDSIESPRNLPKSPRTINEVDIYFDKSKVEIGDKYSVSDLDRLFTKEEGGSFKDIVPSLESFTRVIPFKEIFEHNTSESCWVVIDGLVYDLTKFLPHHPGSAEIITKFAGTDVTSRFDKHHPLKKQILTKLSIFGIGMIQLDLKYQFSDCLDESEQVHKAFYKFLQDVRSVEQLDCIIAIQCYKKTFDTNGHESITNLIKKYIEKESPNEINIDHELREELCKNAKDTEKIHKNFFGVVESQLKLQLKQDLYDLFLISHAFKVWMTTHRLQNDLMNDMDTILNNFDKLGFDDFEKTGAPKPKSSFLRLLGFGKKK